ncbi:hypothetical protein Tsubulata_028107, partial [Turnera subulata]
LLLFQALHFFTTRNQTKRAKLPPGPARLPIIGNLLDLGDKPYKSLARLAKVHGPLMSLKIGEVTTIAISSPSIAKEILQKYDSVFSYRYLPGSARALDHKLRRRQVEVLLADVQEHCLAGKAVDIGQAAFKAITNSLSNTIFSLDLINKSSGTSHKDVVRGIMDELGKPNLSDYFPILRYLDLQGLKRRIEINGVKLFDLYDRIINERMESRRMEGYVPKNDLLDTLLSICEENSDMMNNSLIKHTFMDLFLAGTDTSASVIEWAMAELLRNPRILRKARLVLLRALYFLATTNKSNKEKLPPGPPCLPIIGNLLDLGDKPHNSLAKLAKTYGPLMRLRIGQVTTVVISSATIAKEILQTHDSIFSNRTIPDATRALDHHELRFVWTSVAPAWRNLRKVCKTEIFTTQKLDTNQVLRHKKFKELVRAIVDELGTPNLADYFRILKYFDLQGIRRHSGFHFWKIFDLFDHIINERLQARKIEGYIPTIDMLDTLLSISEENSDLMNNNYIKYLL